MTSRVPGLKRQMSSMASRAPGLNRQGHSRTSRVPGLRRQGSSSASRVRGLRRQRNSKASRVHGLRRQGCSKSSRVPWLSRQGSSKSSRVPGPRSEKKHPHGKHVMSVLSIMKGRYPNSKLVFPFAGSKVYCQFKGRRGINPYRGVLSDVCDNLGLGKQVFEEWCFHTFRHTKITRLAEAGHSATAIQYWAGHKSLAMTQRYIHNAGVGTEELADC